MSRFALCTTFIAACLCGVMSVSAAPLTNGGFESAFTGWSTMGNTSTDGVFNGVTPTEGSFQAVISSASPTISAAALGTFLGAPIPGGTPHSGSGIMQTFNNGLNVVTIGFGIVDVGDSIIDSALTIDNVQIAIDGTLTFDYTFLTDELVVAAGTRNDTAFVVVNGESFVIADRDNSAFPGAAVGPFDGTTGPLMFSQQFDSLVTPEPASLALWSLFAFTCGGLGMRRRRKQLSAA